MMENKTLIVNRLAEHTNEIDRFLAGIDEAELKHRPAPDKWSLFEIIMHLAEVQDVFIDRVARMLVEEKPIIHPFNPDKAREEGWYLSLDFKKRLHVFKAQRSTFVALLRTLTDDQWKAEGRHPEFPRFTIEDCVEALMRHEEHHFYQLFNIVRARTEGKS